MFEPGDKSKAMCPECKKIVSTTMERTPFSFTTISIGGCPHTVTVHEGVKGVCDECGTIVSIPHQTTPEIQKAIKNIAKILGEPIITAVQKPKDE